MLGGAGVIGIDLNPVAWFIVKTEIEPVIWMRCKVPSIGWRRGPWPGTTTRRCARPCSGCTGRRLLRMCRRTSSTPSGSSTRSAPTRPASARFRCSRTISSRTRPCLSATTVDVLCPRCKKRFDWEIEPASLIADTAMMVNSSRGSAGEGRPHQVWTYAPEPEKPKGHGRRDPSLASVYCPHCDDDVRLQVPWDRKKERKKVSLTVLLCPTCEAVWQWRGALPDDAVNCPACGTATTRIPETWPANGAFECSCGSRDKIIESIRLLPQTRRLPVRPYAIQAYLKPRESSFERMPRESLFEDGVAEDTVQYAVLPDSLLLPKNGKFFKRFSASDRANLQRAENLWDQSRTWLSYPKSRIPKGAETARLLEHHYNHWHDMFAPRQLLALATLLNGVMAEKDDKLRETLLCAFSSTLEANNLFTRARVSRKSAGGADGSRVVRAPRLSTQIYNCGEQCIRHRKYCRRIVNFRIFGLCWMDCLTEKKCWEFRHVEDGKREKN